MQTDLIYDVGLHRGEDTEFYLKKGFRVVAIEADAGLCAAARARFGEAISSGRLTIANVAIAAAAGETVFYRYPDKSEWGTADPAWAERNLRLGKTAETVTVRAATLAEIVAEHGVPYFLKIDIEGMDVAALASLSGVAERPRFVSIESEKVAVAKLEAEFAAFAALGYDRFKIVPQHEVRRQRPPVPPLEGNACEHRFARGASGLFGEEAPGRWLTAEEAIKAYRPIFRRYRLVGDDPAIRSRLVRKALGLFGYRAGWYDTHARLAGVRRDA